MQDMYLANLKVDLEALTLDQSFSNPLVFLPSCQMSRPCLSSSRPFLPLFSRSFLQTPLGVSSLRSIHRSTSIFKNLFTFKILLFLSALYTHVGLKPRNRKIKSLTVYWLSQPTTVLPAPSSLLPFPRLSSSFPCRESQGLPCSSRGRLHTCSFQQCPSWNGAESTSLSPGNKIRQK